jgi:hypothetical protein
MRIVPVLPLLILLQILLLSACGKEGKTPEKKDDGPLAVVEAPNGLILRQQPSRNSRSLAVVPYGGRVRYYGVERGAPFTVDGRTGCFVWVGWQGMRGWMFDGYLKQETKPAAFTDAGRFDAPAEGNPLIRFTNGTAVHAVQRRADDPPSPGRVIRLPLPKGVAVTRLLWHADGARLLLACEYGDHDSGAAMLAWVDPVTLAVRATLPAGGFNLGRPLLHGAHVYYTSFGTAGKAVAATGAAVWKLENLYRSVPGRSFANNFTNIVVAGGQVRFMDSDGHTLVVDDATGQNLGWR